MKASKFDSNKYPFLRIQKQPVGIVKIAIFLALVGLAISLCYPVFWPLSVVDVKVAEVLPPPAGDPVAVGGIEVVVGGDEAAALVVGEVAAADSEGSGKLSAKCDIFTGEWVPDPSGPSYSSETCQSIEGHQNCMKNGRRDSGYIYWRWRPRDCEIPRFDPKKFLTMMKGKSMAFIGDSISRNHVQSLLCILSQVEEAKEVYHDEEYRSRRWFFQTHNFTLSVLWSPFLATARIFEDFDGHSSGAVQLHLDKLDSEWVDQFKNFDYIEIAGGKWFLKPAVYYENNTTVGCHNCYKNNITEIGFYKAYRKALNSTLKFITSSNHKVVTLFRTTTPDHFENGQWNTGGYCNRTVPFKGGEVEMVDIDVVMRSIELEEFASAKGLGTENASTLKLVDTTYLSLLRPDGHPGPFRSYQPFASKDKNVQVQNDCLHWCLPGPIDSWNDLIMELLLEGS